LELPRNLKDLLARRGGGLVERVEAFLESAPHRCTYATSERATRYPLHRGFVGRVLGLPTSDPVLGRCASKFGGFPYWEERDLSWDGFAFLGQVNFADIFDPPPECPKSGLLAVDLCATFFTTSFRVRWYPQPRDGAAHLGDQPNCVGRWETRLCFREGWSLPGGDAWHAPLPAGDRELWQVWNDWSPPGYLDDERELCHRLFGHRSGALDDHYGFEPPANRSESIEEYAMVWRITFDNPAGFHWGTNWVYVIIHRDDLALGRFDRCVVTGANA
jgi:hypothetical protein